MCVVFGYMYAASVLSYKLVCECPCMYVYSSLVPRPSLTAFFAAVRKKNTLFSTAAKKSCVRRPGYEATCIPHIAFLLNQ